MTRKRFLLPLPLALVLSFVIWEIRYLLEGGFGWASKMALVTAWFGGLAFPVGLAWLVLPQQLLRTAWPFVSVATYALYIALSFFGWKFSSRKILAALIVLLAVNVVSCQVDSSRIQNTIGIE